MDSGKDNGSFVQIGNVLPSAAWIGQVPWLYWLHDYGIPIIISGQVFAMEDYALCRIGNPGPSVERQ